MSVDTAARPTVAETFVSRHRLGTALIVAAGAYLAAFALMGLGFASSPPPQLLDGLEDFERGLTLYRFGFVGASLLAPGLVTRVPPDALTRVPPPARVETISAPRGSPRPGRVRGARPAG